MLNLHFRESGSLSVNCFMNHFADECLMYKLEILIMICFSAFAASAQGVADTLTIYFRQGKSSVDLSYMGNDTVADRIRHALNTRGGMQVSPVLILGTASPEGSKAINDRLSRERAASIVSFFNIPDSAVSFSFTGSDWEGLQKFVEASPDVPCKSEVVQLLSDIVNTSEKACPTDVLRNMHNGRPYEYLYTRFFPHLRSARIVFGLMGTHNVEPAENNTDETAGFLSDTFGNAVDKSASQNAVDDVADLATFGEEERVDAPDGHYVIGLKTNLLYDAALIPNIGVEFPLGRNFSIGGNWMYSWWKNHVRNRHWRIYGGDISARYWFKSRAKSLSGHHVGVYGTVLVYQVAFGGKGYISGIPGEGMAGGKPWIGGGVEYGYSLKLHPRLNMDFSLGVGYSGGEQRVYRMIEDCYVWQSSSRKQWFGPTKAEISLVWKIGKLPASVKSGKGVGL